MTDLLADRLSHLRYETACARQVKLNLESRTSKRDALIRDAYRLGATYAELGRITQLSRQRIQQICDLSKGATR